MAKNILSFLLICCTFGIASAQSKTFQEGLFNISGGVGFPNTTHAAIDGGSSLFSINGEDTGSSTPMFLLSGVYGISDDIGIGIFGGYFSSDSEIIATGTTLINALNLVGVNINLGEGFGTTRYTVFTLGGKAEIHNLLFRDAKKIDSYASTYLGYNFVQDDFDSVKYFNADNSTVDTPFGTIDLNELLGTTLSNANYPTMTYDVNAGLRYSFSDQLSAYGEAGYGRFLVNLGLTYSIN